MDSANEKDKELESVVGKSQALISDVGLRREEPEEESGAQGTATGREPASQSTGETSKRHSENSEDEPPRKMRPVPTRATEEDVTLSDKYGMSPLHRAASDGEVQKMRELIWRGADTRVRDRLGRTPLHLALWEREDAAANLLVEADPGNDIADTIGMTPLHVAALTGHVVAVRRLLAGGARTRAQDYSGCTPLHNALEIQVEAAAELLAEADGSINIRDNKGRTPLHYAAEAGFVGIVATLLRNDLNPHLRDNRGKYPIHHALSRRWLDDVPKMIISSCALKDIAMDWGELKLAAGDLRYCFGELSLCSAEVQLMKETKVGASSISCHDLVTWHVSRVAPRLPSESLQGVRWDRRKRVFPHYADLISLRLRSAKERRASMDRCLHCFSLLPPELPPLPVTCTGVILRCVSGTDMKSFIHAVKFPSRKKCSNRSQ